MKYSIFWKLVLIMLPLVLLTDCAILFATYTITYNQTLEHCKDDVRQAALIAAKYFEIYDPYVLEDAEQCSKSFDELCEAMDMAYIYTEIPYPELNHKQYLAIGYGKDAADSAKATHYPGYIAYTVIDEEIIALKENKTVFRFYDNEYGNTIICFTPVKQHVVINYSSDNFDAHMVNETISIAGAEMSINNIIETVRQHFRRILIIVLFTSVLIVFIISFIFQQKIVKPTRLISRKMSEFILNRDKDFEPLDIKGHDELAQMSESFNSMAQEIDRYIEDISTLNREKAMQETELNIARNIQMGFLEPADFQNENSDIHANMMPAKDVGGDLYDYKILSNGNICVIIADVSGKGVSAALFMTNAITMLRQYAEAGLSPEKIMFEYNNHLAAHNPNMMFITTFIGIYDPSTGEFVYSNAGHNPPYLLSDKLIEIESSCEAAAGIFSDEQYTKKSLVFKPGDTVFLYTDGVTEAKSADDKLFGDERLRSVLSEHLHESGKTVMDAVLDEIKVFADNAVQSDDITILTLTVPKEKKHSMHLEAKTENLAVINKYLMSLDISDTAKRSLKLMAEEIFVNICSYAYDNGNGKADVCIISDKTKVTITFTDSGKQFDPTKDLLNIEDYDMDNSIGGLGRFMTFNIADEYSYEYKDGKNILSITKNI